MGICYNLCSLNVFCDLKRKILLQGEKTKQKKNANFRSLGAASLLFRGPVCLPCSTV